MQTITILPMIDIGPGTFNNLRQLTTMNLDMPRLTSDLNDRLRETFSGGRVMLTRGVQGLPDDERGQLLRAVREFDAFDAANDPHAEHDFGRVLVAGHGYFWKIDYFDSDLQYLSPDPADEAVTTRVMTIMREDEY
ncbi:DUF3768 domain-containing protein [Neorhizobium galegae]|uniref:DUF3768 domain-containing protein n=1 Tax=Neorhizobium galegae bv. officinalis TaxID=323656 RepID=A0A0T7GAI3_NEOGA|nr:DUF3768 domain-containing protein [Neorhizobium galegae]CDZ44272.1 Hypothetical protein NGAL_HAMBI1189_02670 [Neorhizobium galegae bv. officinalis]